LTRNLMYAAYAVTCTTSKSVTYLMTTRSFTQFMVSDIKEMITCVTSKSTT